MRKRSAQRKSYCRCELRHRRRRSSLLIYRQQASYARVWRCASGAFAFRNLLGDRYGRFSSHGHALQLVHRVHHERVYREISRALNSAHRDFPEAPPVTDGAFSCSQSAHSRPAEPSREGGRVMWQYFGPDFAFDVVKGVVAGIASLAVQVVAPRTFRAATRFRARWVARRAARRAARQARRNTVANDER